MPVNNRYEFTKARSAIAEEMVYRVVIEPSEGGQNAAVDVKWP